MTSADSAFLFGLFAGLAIGIPTGVLIMWSTRRGRRILLGDARQEFDLDLAPAEFRSQR